MDGSQVMVLTGCASGIGCHLVGALSQRGHRIVATDLNESGLVQQARLRAWGTSNVLLRKLDVRSADEWEAALGFAQEKWGGVDVLMNIAGYLRPGYVHETTASDVELHLDVNVKGTVLGTRAAARLMIPAKHGHIVNFGSLASLAPVPGLGLYAASKFAVRGFSLAAATELLPHGVYVTVVMPDAVQTPMLDKQVAYEQAALTFSGARPLTVEEIEQIIVQHVLTRRPIEVAIPRVRSTLARIANTFPRVSQWLAPMLMKRGLARQAQVRTHRPS